MVERCSATMPWADSSWVGILFERKIQLHSLGNVQRSVETMRAWQSQTCNQLPCETSSGFESGKCLPLDGLCPTSGQNSSCTFAGPEPLQRCRVGLICGTRAIFLVTMVEASLGSLARSGKYTPRCRTNKGKFQIETPEDFDRPV